MNLDPETYLCPTHLLDLTALVRQQLSSDLDADVAFGGHWVERLMGRSAQEPQRFQVLVSCPSQGNCHQQLCEGTFVP